MATFAEHKREWQRRLDELKLRAARAGYTVDPSITTEIEDIQALLGQTDQIEAQLRLLEVYRRNLAGAIKQRALYGMAAVPTITVNNIRESRTNIADLKRALLKHYKVSVPDEPGDLETDDTPMPEVRVQDPLALVWERLHTIETFVRLGDTRQALAQIEELRRLLR